MKTVPVRDAIGCVLCHDITRIVPGHSKGPVFRKGHVIRPEDIEVLLSVGKEHLFVYEPLPDQVHENEAARRLAEVVCGDGCVTSEPREGRIDFSARRAGLLSVDTKRLMQLNSLGEITFATLHSLQYVHEGEAVAGIRVVPLLINEAKLARAEALCHTPLLDVLPLMSAKVGIVTTGSEVAKGRITDAFGPVLRQKFAALGSAVVGQTIVNDELAVIARAISAFLAQGCDLIAVTGGMSVDPDDCTPGAIRAAGCHIVQYGAPVYPGAMFLLAYAERGGARVPVLGLPGCVMYYKTSIFDVLVPRLLAGLTITSDEINALGHGGFCRMCEECRYPRCPFGK